MLALKYLLMILGLGLFGSAGALVVYDVYISQQLRRLLVQAKVIDSQAEVERQKNLAEAKVNRIRVTATADVEHMKYEASVLKQNPMLISENHRGTTFRQTANYDGADGRQEFLCSGCDAVGVRQQACCGRGSSRFG